MTTPSSPRTMSVSSPHRYCQNLGGRLDRADSGSVSSPHRYCQNAIITVTNRSFTEVSSPHRYCQNVRMPISTGSGHSWFQALIGTAKTPASNPTFTTALQVSSPHRYCQNGCPRGSLHGLSEVSSPHRYCQNSVHRSWTTRPTCSFKPS